MPGTFQLFFDRLLFAVAGVADLDHRCDEVVEVGFFFVENVGVEGDLERVFLFALRRQQYGLLMRHAHDLGQEDPDGYLNRLGCRVGDDHVAEVVLLIVLVERAEDRVGPDRGVFDGDNARVIRQR
jgi:hypothetical protein